MADQFGSEDESHDLDAEAQEHGATEHYDDQPPVDDFADPDHVDSEGAATVEESSDAPIETNVIEAEKKKSSGSIMILGFVALVAIVGGLVYFKFFAQPNAPVVAQIQKTAPTPQLVAQEVLPVAPKIEPKAPQALPAIGRDAPIDKPGIDVTNLKLDHPPAPLGIPGLQGTPTGVAAPSTATTTATLVSPSAATAPAPSPLANNAPDNTGAAMPAPTTQVATAAPQPVPVIVATPTKMVPPPAPAPVVAVTPASPTPSPIMAMPVAEKPVPGNPVVSSATDSRLTALSVRVSDLQKSLDQATAQITRMSTMIASMPNPAAGSVTAKLSSADEDRLTKIEQNLARLQNETQSGITAAAPVASTPDVSLNNAPKVSVHKHAVHTTKVATAKSKHPKVLAKAAIVPATSKAWVLRAATPDEAWVAKSATSEDLRRVQVGDMLPGIGHVIAITQDGDAWAVKGSTGVIR